ncbi:MAG: LysR family transcriptional regulator [Burkholderiaceae bacterium]|nr:LysR family transcriptional regulator [Burkholderiaceae bacterium]
MNARLLSWQDLQFFLATARGATLAAAAESLGVSAATVHRRLARLEAELATGLFARSQRGYSLTAAGSELLAHAQSIDDEVVAAQRRVSGRDQSPQGTIRVSTVDDLAVMVLGSVLRDFSRLHEGVRLEVSIDSDFADLARRQADVAIRPGARPATGDLIARRVCTVGVALYASRDYLARHGEPAGPGALAGHRVVRADQGRASLPMERFIDRYTAPDAAAFRSNSMLARVLAVREGLGLGMLPCFAADPDPALVRLGPVHDEASSALWILVHADLRRNARVRAFVEYVHDALSRERSSFEGRVRSGGQGRSAHSR